MVKHQLGIAVRPSGEGLQRQLEMLSDAMREAFFAACDAYEALHIPFALVGGLAAGAHGRPRFTMDIDFLVGEEAFLRSGLIVSFAKPMPLQAGGAGRRIPVLGATPLAYMKLASPRGKDRDDIVAMMQAGRVDRGFLEAAVRGDQVLEERLAQALAELALAEE